MNPVTTPPSDTSPPSPEADGTWCLYLIECRNGSYYAGITNRLGARYAAHVAGRGARYTRANPPVRLLGWRNYPDRASAARAEWEIRQLPRESKPAFLLGG
ncbi:MAG: GIY-YIG nuclease family protein [Xanthomonadaceae bacterium]|nr:GIY-YIG nuclease family protein [Xanthomonadaceae bacterium]